MESYTSSATLCSCLKLRSSQTTFILFTSSLSLLHLLYHRLRSEASLNSPNYTSPCYPRLPTLLLHFIFPKLSYLCPTNLSLIGPLIPIRIVNDFCPGPFRTCFILHWSNGSANSTFLLHFLISTVSKSCSGTKPIHVTLMLRPLSRLLTA